MQDQSFDRSLVAMATGAGKTYTAVTFYLDSSALMKLVREEHEIVALSEWLNARPD